MSAWRRIAIEHIPSCQKTIEEAKDPCSLWIYLYHELLDFDTDKFIHTVNEQKSSEIFRFAFLCLNNNVHPLLTPDVEGFFDYVLNSDMSMKYLLQHYPGELKHLKKAYPESFPSDLHF